MLLIMVFVWRRMENKEPIKSSGKVIGATLLVIAVAVKGIVYLSNGGFPAVNLIFV